MIIPTGDSDVLALSKHKLELEEYYYLPVPSFEIVQKLANKKTFYKLLAEMNIPHPKTYFPESISDLRVLGSRLDYPYIIKPALSLPFACEFERKNFVIHSPKELSWAIDKLKGKNLDVIIQEIIPGKEIYMFYTYFNKKSEPLAICGYDKIRQYPDDYGSGSFCRSNWILSPIDECIKLLKTIRYYGFAEPELIKDPRDGSYKLLEINARTTTQNRLAAACGADMEYISYLDAAGYSLNKLNCSQNDVFWVDDFSDQISCCIRFKQKELGGREILRSLIMERKVHSIVALDDPVPFILMTRDIIQWNILNALRRGNDLFKRMLS